MKKSILILAYYSYRDPVFQSAVLPYFVNFPLDKNFHFVLLTYEHAQYAMSKVEMGKTKAYLQGHNITWYQSRWRSGKLKAVKKLIDFLATVATAWRLIRKYQVCAIYSEGFPGAILGYYASKVARVKHMVHTFEPHADYMIEAGVWKETSWETRLMRWHEKKIALHATYIFTATALMIERLKKEGVKQEVLYRVPSCVDLEHFRFNPDSRDSLRKQLGIEVKQPVLVYLGKFGGMYMEEEAFEFFKLCQQELNAWIMILSTEDGTKLLNLARKFEMVETNLFIKTLTREEVPAYLSVADMAFVGVRQWPSKKYCSPIKTGEYLACGLPVIVPEGISDDFLILAQSGVGIILPSFKKSSFQLVINEWKRGFIENGHGVRELAREYVTSDRSIFTYKNLYAELFKTL